MKPTPELLRHLFYNFPACQTQAIAGGKIEVTPTDSSKVAAVQMVIQHLDTLGAEVWSNNYLLHCLIEAQTLEIAQLRARVAELEAQQQAKEEVAV
jgi:hypothetical protein